MHPEQGRQSGRVHRRPLRFAAIVTQFVTQDRRRLPPCAEASLGSSRVGLVTAPAARTIEIRGRNGSWACRVYSTMVNVGIVKTLRVGGILVLLVAGCIAIARLVPEPSLPPIIMTSHGGFETMSQKWAIAADGSWTFTESTKSFMSHPAEKTARSGRLTAEQQHALAVLAADPALYYELQTAPGRCTTSDGPTERLDVGSVRYVASWCPEYRPLIARIRARIEALTIGD
jgi:hypothetical protein